MDREQGAQWLDGSPVLEDAGVGDESVQVADFGGAMRRPEEMV